MIFLDENKRRFDAEAAGALTPDLEGAAHSKAHLRRLPLPTEQEKKRGEALSAKVNSQSGPKRP